MRIIGIDPGTAIMGWGVIDENNSTLTLIECGAIRTQAGLPHPERLLTLYNELGALIRQYQPTNAAIEELFFW